jgi:carbamate kinase
LISFAPGWKSPGFTLVQMGVSMVPGGTEFTEATGRHARICALLDVAPALQGERGTTIVA